MKCPKCGGQARYVLSRKKFWGNSTKATEPRKDFKAKCIRCGLEFDASKVYNVKDILLEKE